MVADPHAQGLRVLMTAIAAAREQFHRDTEAASRAYVEVVETMAREELAWARDPSEPPPAIAPFNSARTQFRSALTAAEAARDAAIERAVTDFKATG